MNLLLLTIATADTVYLKTGQKLTGRIIAKDSTGVIIETKLGAMKIKLTQIDWIEQISTEENYLKEGDTWMTKGELEKALSAYQQGYTKTQSPALKQKLDKLTVLLEKKKTELDEKQKTELVGKHLTEYKRLKDKLADELALRELESAQQLDPDNLTILELLCRESFVYEDRNGFVDAPSKFAQLATRLFDIGSADTTLRDYFSRYTTALQRKAEQRARFELLVKEQEKAELERQVQREQEQEKTAPTFDYDAAFYPEAAIWYSILDSPLYNFGRIPIMTVKGMRVYRADTTADIPQLIPINGLMNIPATGIYAKLRIKKKVNDEITFGTMEIKGTLLPILLQLWDNQMLYSTKGASKLSDTKAQELLNNKTLEITIQWDTDTTKN